MRKDPRTDERTYIRPPGQRGPERRQRQELDRKLARKKLSKEKLIRRIVLGTLLVLILLLGFLKVCGGTKLGANGSGVQSVGTKVADRGRGHVPDRTPVEYDMPPTSGKHWATPAPWGAYTETFPEERTVHNLEHGGIVILYNNIPPADVARLRGLFNSYQKDSYGEVKLVLEPYSKIETGTFYLTAWNYKQQFVAFEEVSIKAFMDAHMNKCCEEVP